jgi:hypothetical protein
MTATYSVDSPLKLLKRMEQMEQIGEYDLPSLPSFQPNLDLDDESATGDSSLSYATLGQRHVEDERDQEDALVGLM